MSAAIRGAGAAYRGARAGYNCRRSKGAMVRVASFAITELALRPITGFANQFGFSEIVSIPQTKNIPLSFSPKSSA
jgi:hypothetical protein